MPRRVMAFLASAVAFSLAGGAQAVGFVARRPAASTWQRTQCGGPIGKADIPSKWAAEVSPEAVPLSAYPRPQMVRARAHELPEDLAQLRDAGDAATWSNLNGLWEWEAAASETPPFGRPLAGSILVPFPVESCLSGVAPNRSSDVTSTMWYRLSFDAAAAAGAGRTLLHFGAVDWETTVYMNGALLGKHRGGYDGFSFDVTAQLKGTDNELLVYVFDPSDQGAQPNGKQRLSAIDKPGGDTYTPSSGIWQTVWLEQVPHSYVESLKIDQASTSAVTVTANVVGGDTVRYTVLAGGKPVASASGASGAPVAIEVPSAKLWSPESPHLYDLAVEAGDDRVLAYFGLRTFKLGKAAGASATRPLLNGEFTFMAGFLDQSFWPDGLYTAPTDEALEYDLLATKAFGLNMIRLHQKVNPERWYYHADRHGLVLFQDMIQKYGGATNETIPLFKEEMAAMVAGRGNHPCIVQWTIFNEGDCFGVFNATEGIPSMVEFARRLDPTRLLDTDSGGGANNLHIGDVNDIHSYPFPGNPEPSATQYAMVGEFGGLGITVEGKEWVPGGCFGYKKVNTTSEGADIYVSMAQTFIKNIDHVSASVYTQTTDVEDECDGFLNYDRSNKFDAEHTKAVREANLALIAVSKRSVNGPPANLEVVV